MGTIVHLRAPKSFEKEKATPPEVMDVMLEWLDQKPKNTRALYLRVAERWSKFLLKQKNINKGALWQGANLHHVQLYVNQYSQHDAQSGRSMESSVNGKVSRATVRHNLIVLKSIYDRLIAVELLVNNPFIKAVSDTKHLTQDPRRPHRKLPKSAVKKLLTFNTETEDQMRDRAIFHVLFAAALRRSEVAALRIGDVQETDEGTIFLRLRYTKVGVVQTVALPDFAAKELVRWREFRYAEGGRDSDPLFVRYCHEGPVAISDVFIYRLFKHYCKALRLGDGFSPHCARVTAITQLLDQDVPHREVQELSRHSSIAMVEKYDRKRKEIDRSASKKLSYDDE